MSHNLTGLHSLLLKVVHFLLPCLLRLILLIIRYWHQVNWQPSLCRMVQSYAAFLELFNSHNIFIEIYECNMKLVGYLVLLHWVQTFFRGWRKYVYYVTADLLYMYQGHEEKFQGLWARLFLRISVLCLLLHPVSSGLVSHPKMFVTTKV
jgi:hypothetical protein